MEMKNQPIIALGGIAIGVAIGYFIWNNVVTNIPSVPEPISEEIPVPESAQKQQVVVEYIWPELEIDNSDLTQTYTSFNGDFTLSYPDYFFYKPEYGDCEGCSEFTARTCPEETRYANHVFVSLVARPLSGQLIDKYGEAGTPFYMAYSLEQNKWEPKRQDPKDTVMFPRASSYEYYFPKTFITNNGYTAHMYGTGDENGGFRQIVLVEHPDRKSYVHIILSSGTYTCGGLLGDTVGLKVANSLKFLKSSSGE